MEKQAEFIDFFNALPDWQERYRYIIELGEKLPKMPDCLKTPANRLSNCPSRMFFHVSRSPVINIQADGNSPISLGLAGILAFIFNGLPAEQFNSEDVIFLFKTGLISNLSTQRQEALKEMLRKLEQGQRIKKSENI